MSISVTSTTEDKKGKVYNPRFPLIAMRHLVTEALDALAGTIGKLRELREWHALEQEELRPGVPPSFRLSNHTREDALSVYFAFEAGALAVQETLNDPDLAASPMERHQWQNRLDGLRAQVRGVADSERFIRP